MSEKNNGIIPQLQVLWNNVKDCYEGKSWGLYEKFLHDYNLLLNQAKKSGYAADTNPVLPVPEGAKLAFGKAERTKMREIIYEIEKLMEVLRAESGVGKHDINKKSSKTVFDSLSNRYTYVSQIGDGGSGVVYAVKDEDGGDYALKLIPPTVVSRDKSKRFRNEIGFCEKTTHKNILKVVDSGFALVDGKKCPFYVMRQYGDTLRKLMTRGITKERVMGYFSQLLDGVEAAHMIGVWHRDLKPENILVDTKLDTLVVADFGIAHFEEEMLQTLIKTSPNSRLANFQYAAPEQRERGGAVDQRADIYSLGLILNEMFTKKLAHGTGFMRIHDVCPEKSYLDDLVDAMLKQSPSARPGTIAEVKSMLIGLKEKSVSRQKISALSAAVVPETAVDDPLIATPPKLSSAKLDDGVLKMQLSCSVNGRWIAHFNYPKSSYSSFMGKGPEAYHVTGNMIVVQSNGDDAQQTIAYAKSYIEIANRTYKSEIEHEHLMQIAKENERLERAMAKAKKEQLINENLKI